MPINIAADKKQWSVILALAFLVAVPLALFLPALLSNKLPYGFDTIGLGFPFSVEIRRALAAHEWPLWMNGVYGGMPGIAGCNLYFLYPSDLISSLAGWSLPVQYDLDAMLHVALAGIGMFLFLRRLGRSASGALLGALFFAVSGSEISWLYEGSYSFVEGIALVPWAFWAAHKGRQENSWLAWGLCGLFFALQILSISIQLFAYTLPAVALFTLASGLSPDGRLARPRGAGSLLKTCLPTLQGLALALALAALLSAPQLWLTLQYLPLSARHGYSIAELKAGSISFSEALTWWVPGLFGWQEPTYHGSMGTCFISQYFGLLPWALAAASACLLPRERPVRWLAGLALAAFFFAQNYWAPFLPLFQRLPVLSGFRDWSRALFLTTFSVCALAAYGWDALRYRTSRSGALRASSVFWALALASTAAAWGIAKASADAAAPAMPWIPGGAHAVAASLTAQARGSVCSAWALIAGGAALLWFSTKRLGVGTALALVLAFHALDQSSVVSRCVRFVDPQTMIGHPDFTLPPPPRPGLEPWRVFDPDSRSPNNDLLLGYENLAGTESMPIRSYLLIQEAMQATPKGWSDWLNLMNVRYVFSHSKREPYLPGDKVTISENKSAFPRAWLVGRSLKASDESAAYRLLADPHFALRDEVALQIDAALDRPPPQGGVRWLERSPQTFSLAVTTDRNAALVVSNAWYPSWKADVDGQAVPVLKADGGLQAVLVSAGKHQVDFHFDPTLFYEALAAGAAGLAALAGLAFMRRSGPPRR
jgi:hypothetical protein